MNEARFAVVGCLTKGCRALWIIEDRHTHDTATCPQCGSAFATDRFRAFAQADEWEAACELRARIAADRAGQYDAYADEDDYGQLAERAEEHLTRYDDLFGSAVDDAAARQRRRQRELFAPAAERYLDQSEPYQEAAAAYLERRRRERKQIVEASNTETATTQVTPFQERTAAAESNLTLTTPETLPADVDVRVREPDTGATDLWKSLWQNDRLQTRFCDALHTLTGETYQSAWATLVEDGGVTAPASTPAPSYAEYLLDGLKRPTDETWFDSLRVTRQLGGSTPFGNTERDDIINGPVALFAACDVTPRIAVHLSHDFFEHKRIQRVRLLDFLVELSRGMDIRIVCHGSLAPKKLLRLHEADLPSRCVTEAPQPYHDAAKQAGAAPREVAEAALTDLGLDHPAITVLERLADESSERLAYGVLKADTVFSVSEAAVGKRVRTLIEHRLVSKDQFNTTNYIQLLPAGSRFLDRREQELDAQDVQTVLDGFSSAETDDSAAESAASTDLTDPPKHSHGTVYTGASTGRGVGGDGAMSEEEPLAVAGVDDDVVAAGEWLSLDQQTAVSSAVSDDFDIALADEPAPTRDHCGDYQVGYNEAEQEIVVSLQPSPLAARTVTRLCAALLDPRLINTLLTPERLDGADGEDLGSLLDDAVSPAVLRAARQLGWLPDRAATGEDYPEQLISAMKTLFSDVDDIGSGEDFDPELARSVCRRGQGLAGTITHIYDLLGWNVIRELTFPEYSRHFHEDRSTHLQTLATQVAITSRYGHYPMSRIVYEERADKRDGSLGAPAVDDIDPSGDLIGSWVLRGPGIDRMASELSNLEAYANLDVQDEGANFAAFFTDIQIGQATRLESVRETARRLCHMKQLEPTRPATALLYALTGSVYQTATALSGLAAETDPSRRTITLDEVRFALATLDPASLLPELDEDEEGTRRKSARSKLLHAQLTASTPLTTSEWAEKAGVSEESIRTHRDDLTVLGLLEIDDRGAGRATFYRLRLPFRDERGDDDAPRPTHLVAPEDESQSRSIRDVVCDLLEARALFEDALDDQAISDGLVGWPPSLEPVIERWSWLRPWCDVIARLLGVEGGGSLQGPSEWIEGPFEFTSRFGTEPATRQAQLGV
ncbi:DUF5817 domain-containing protein [Halocatena marina]|uniref:DUF5817 domain-containing protein n=1 Tax=Halocatena marina TaxID=2934937 RepID=UPI00200C62AB|nr:DUF5817 domain-containing protein [Halocatena marina]